MVFLPVMMPCLSKVREGPLLIYEPYQYKFFYRKFQEIDEYIAKAKDQGYHTVLNLGTKGVNYATTVIMQTAIKVSWTIPYPFQR